MERLKKLLGMDCTDKHVNRILKPVEDRAESVRDSAMKLNKALENSHSYKIGRALGVINHKSISS